MHESRGNPLVLVIGTLISCFLIWLIVGLVADRVRYLTDPHYQMLVQAGEDALAQQVYIRETIITIGLGLLVIGLIAFVWIALVILLRQLLVRLAVVYPNPYGYPAPLARDGARIIVGTPPPLQLTAGPNANDLPGLVSAYTQALPPGQLPLGLRRDGAQVTTPLFGVGATMLAGNSGSGKTELVASLIVTAARLWQAGGQPLNVAVLDPKGMDFARMPRGLPFMPYPVVSEPKAALDLLQHLSADAERRKAELTRLGAVSLEHAQSMGAQFPVWLLIVDELSMFTFQQSKDYRAKFEKGLEEFASRGPGQRLPAGDRHPAPDRRRRLAHHHLDPRGHRRLPGHRCHRLDCALRREGGRAAARDQGPHAL